jgi:N-formylglutamate amidohydrolase
MPIHIADCPRRAAAEAEGYSVAVDAPFSGALVPLASYRRDHRILSVMIEVNRRLYMDEMSGKKTHDLGKMCAKLGRLVMAAAEAAVKEASALAKPTG